MFPYRQIRMGNTKSSISNDRIFNTVAQYLTAGQMYTYRGNKKAGLPYDPELGRRIIQNWTISKSPLLNCYKKIVGSIVTRPEEYDNNLDEYVTIPPGSFSTDTLAHCCGVLSLMGYKYHCVGNGYNTGTHQIMIRGKN